MVKSSQSTADTSLADHHRTDTPDRRRLSETERTILVAARAEFVRRGVSGARMAAIASRARVNKALIHYYFRSKENLYRRVLGDIMTTVIDSLSADLGAVEPDDNPRAVIETLVTAYTRTLRENPEFPVIMMREFAGGGHDIPTVVEQISSSFMTVPPRLYATLSRAADKGRIRRMEPLHIMMNVLGMTLATFFLRPVAEVVHRKMTGETLRCDENFYRRRIETITRMACEGIIRKDA